MIRIMKKSKLLATVLLFAMFSSLLTVGNYSSPASGSAIIPASSDVSPDAIVPGPMGTKGVWLQDVSGETIFADGDLSDWGSTIHDVFNGVDVYIGYDSSDVYVGLAWEDSSRDGKLSEWNKTGSATLDNATHGTYDQLAGADDMLAIGFTNSSGYSDIWIWMESIRSDNAYAYEVNGSWAPDGGVLPYDENFDTTTKTGWDQPDRYNNTNDILDHDGLVNGTSFIGWFESLTPTLSQTDVEMGYTWNASGDDMYVVEFIRDLDTGLYADDILLDLGNATELGLMKFWLGTENKQNCFDFSVGTTKYNMEPPGETNVAAELEWDIIAGPVYEALLLQGAVYDDYVVEADDFTITLSGWEDTYGASYYSTIATGINDFTGDWSYLFYYDEDDMPLGNNMANITWTPKYDDVSTDITSWQWVNISDIASPQILGLVDVNEQYPDGVPEDATFVPVTVGAKDNYLYYSSDLGGYTDKDSLVIYLFSWVDDGVALMSPMEQFTPGGSTFTGNITLTPLAAGETRNISYFVEVWDPSNNKATSVHYWFIQGVTLITPGFGILAGLFGLAGAAFIIFKKKRK